MARKSPHTLQEAERNLFDEEAKLKYELARIGDKIAVDKHYEQLSGIDAVHRYFIDKYHWLPSEVRALSVDDLSMLLDGYPRKSQPKGKR